MYCLTSNERDVTYIENGAKNMSFLIKDNSVLVKHNEIWNKIKRTLNIKFQRMPVDDEKYIKDKVKEFNFVIKSIFLGDEVPSEGVHYACIACITIDYPQLYLEECKYKIKKIKMSEFSNAELESDASSESE